MTILRQNSAESKLDERAQVLDTALRVTTPEKVSFQYQVVGPFRRVISYGIDWICSIFLFFVLSFSAGVFYTFVILPLATRIGLGGFATSVASVLVGMWLVALFLVYWFYGAIMETYFNGQTIGKMVLRYRVLSKDGHAIDGVQAILRNFFRLLDIMPFAPIPFVVELFDFPPGMVMPTCLFGMIAMTISPKFQRLGDLVAGTIVVIEEKKWTPNLAKFEDERVASLAELIPSDFQTSRSMSRALADYVEQRQFLPYLRASEIASHLARPLIEKFGLPEDTDYDLMLCSLYYKSFMQFQTDEPGFHENPNEKSGQVTPNAFEMPQLPAVGAAAGRSTMEGKVQ